MKTELVKMEIPADSNLILGQSHFIKTVEDICEALINTVPNIQFGLAFCEASGKCLVRFDGNDEDLTNAACRNAMALSAGHSFVLLIKNAFPINVTGRLKDVPEICRLFCATANPVEVILARSSQGSGIMGVIDGSEPKGIESDEDKEWRKKFLRDIGYKY